MKHNNLSANAIAIGLIALLSLQAVSAKAPQKTGTQGPGTLIGLNYGMYHNGYHSFSGSKSTNNGPVFSQTFTPAFQTQLSGQWYGSLGFGYNTYKSTDYYTQGIVNFTNTVNENYFGPSLEVLRYCDDPCDDDDWYPYMGLDLSYFAGSRKESTYDDATKKTSTVNGKVMDLNVGLVGGAYYDLGKNFGLFGRMNMLSWDRFKTIDNKANENNYRVKTGFNFFNGGSLGLYFKLGK